MNRIKSEHLVLAAILLATFLLHLRNLGHDALTYWDESFHALVARNLLEHPLKPTLIEVPYLDYDRKGWGENHVWLHKPILPLWQIMISYAIFGINTFAVRLPSALMATFAAGFTYLIGKAWLSRNAGLVAAAIQGMNMAILSLTHGYLYSDHIDVALLFWTEAGIYFVARAARSGAWGDVAFAGIAQGCAYLSKSYLAGIVLGIALTAWLLPVFRLVPRDELRFRLRHVWGLLGITVAVVAPWTLYCIWKYPVEFWHEHDYVWKHLNTDIEAWGAPWDRLVFDYSVTLYREFYTPVLVAGFALLGRLFTSRNPGLWMTYAWAAGVLIPHILATTKTPSATVIGMPPFFLLFGYLVSEAWRARRWETAVWLGVVGMSLAYPAVIAGWGRGYPESGEFGAVMKTALWVVWHVVGALGIGTALSLGVRFWRRHAGITVKRWETVLRNAALGMATAGTLLLGVRYAHAAWKESSRNENSPTYSQIADYAREHLPENAVLLFDEEVWGEHQLTTYRAYRTCYTLRDRNVNDTARKVLEKGGIPYVVSYRSQPYPLVYVGENDKRSIYQWQPTEKAGSP